MNFQKEISVGPYPRGFHIITSEIVNELPILTGLVHVFIKHTSASLTINENADPEVRDGRPFFQKFFAQSLGVWPNLGRHFSQATGVFQSRQKSPRSQFTTTVSSVCLYVCQARQSSIPVTTWPVKPP